MLKHIAIIMDGNGRWATARKMSRTRGHKKGSDAAKTAMESCITLGVPYLTLYAFSSENWKRPAGEVSDLMQLLRYYLDHEISNLHKNGIRLKVIGDVARLDADIRKRVEKAEALTKDNTKLFLNLALSYGSRQEISHAAAKIAADVAAGKIKPDDISEETVSTYLYTNGIPDPDLLIRTGGEERISNFLLWQCAYTEFYFTDTLWPDFNLESMKAAVEEFGRRERRFGGTSEQAENASSNGALSAANS